MIMETFAFTLQPLNVSQIEIRLLLTLQIVLVSSVSSQS